MKQRLIDAKALIDDGANYVWSRFADGSLIKKEIRFVNREQIDNAPTVEAIPIEWIKQYISRKIANDTTMFHWWSIFATDCKNMYEEWEAENGIQ